MVAGGALGDGTTPTGFTDVENRGGGGDDSVHPLLRTSFGESEGQKPKPSLSRRLRDLLPGGALAQEIDNTRCSLDCIVAEFF